MSGLLVAPQTSTNKRGAKVALGGVGRSTLAPEARLARGKQERFPLGCFGRSNGRDQGHLRVPLAWRR